MSRLRKFLRPPRRLKFTREGKYFVALTLGIGFAAINTGNNLLYLLLGMMMSLIIGSGVLSELSLRGLTVRRLVPDRIFAGTPFLMGIALHNPRRRLPSFSIEVEDMLRGKALERRCYFLKTPAGRTQNTSYRHSFDRRGAYAFSGFRVSTRFPFTFFRKSREWDDADEVIVFPQVFPVTPPQSDAEAMTEQHSHRLDRRGDFFALREYQEGDDPRDIHWRKSARLGRLVLRQHEDQRGRRMAVYLDNHEVEEVLSIDQLDRQERAVSLAASLAKHYIERGYSVSLVTREGGVQDGAGQAHLSRILRCLALVSFQVGEPSPYVLDPPPGGACIFVSRGGCSLGRPPARAA